MNENEKQSSEDDSDIPKRRYANLSNFFRDMEQSSEEEPRRKRYKRSFDDWYILLKNCLLVNHQFTLPNFIIIHEIEKDQ